MKLVKSTFIIFILISFSCNSRTQMDINLNSNIKEFVEKEITDSLKNNWDCSYGFLNNSLPKFYINDSLYIPPKETKGYEYYEASWGINKDSIFINGSNNMTDGARAFNAQIVDNKSLVEGYLRTHIFVGNLGLNRNGPKFHAMPLSVKHHILTLNKIPVASDSIIYGHLKFETDEFYVFKDSDTTNFEIDSEMSYIEEVYFKARKCSKN